MKRRVFLSLILGLTLVSCEGFNLDRFSFSSPHSEDSSMKTTDESTSEPNLDSTSINTSEEEINSSSSHENNSSENKESTSSKTSSSSTQDSSSQDSTSESLTSSVTTSSATADYDDLYIHFLELGNANAGDSVYIKAGDTDILIDAGSKRASAPTLDAYIKKYCTDGKLEYVIATHAHEDHISGFAGDTNIPGIFDLYETGTIIDYAKTDKKTAVKNDYEAKRNEEVAKGAKHFTAADCINQNNGASTTYTIAKGITLNILDQKYYYEKSSDENNYSVCCLISQGDNHFLFTGDLEEAGEKSLVERNPNLPHVRVFKGGHHGSNTSSNEILLSKITPEVVCVCCCAGTSEYSDEKNNQFPTQDFINRVAKYTEKVYVTSQTSRWQILKIDGKECINTSNTKNLGGPSFTSKSMNGNITVSSTAQGWEVHGSNNDTKLKDTEWFNTKVTLDGVTSQMRTWPNVDSLYK